jgi:hypothetical protein
MFSFADRLGPEKIVHIHEPRIGLKAVVVVDNTAAGPAIGGTRMAPEFERLPLLAFRHRFPTLWSVLSFQKIPDEFSPRLDGADVQPVSVGAPHGGKTR